MGQVTFKMPYSGSVSGFKQMKKGEKLEVNEIEKAILSRLGVIEGSPDHTEKVVLEARENIKASKELQTKEEKSFEKKAKSGKTVAPEK